MNNKLFIEHVNDRGTDKGYYFAGLLDVKLWLAERGLVAVPLDAYKMAEKFHSIYERLAPDFDYETRDSSAVAWCDVPDNNKNLMVATCIELIAAQGES